MVEIFPTLTVLDQKDVNQDSAGDSILQNVYAIQGSDKPFTGMLDIPPSSISPHKIGVFENGKLQKLIFSTDSYYEETYFNETRDSKNFISQGWYTSGKLKNVHYLDHSGKQYHSDGSLVLAYSDSANIYNWKNGNPKIYWPVDPAAMKQSLDLDSNPAIYQPALFRKMFKKGNGQMKAWHKNGQHGIKGRMVNNKRIGRWTEYDSLGNVTRQLAYE